MSKNNIKMEGCCGRRYQAHSRNIAILLIICTSIPLLLTIGTTLLCVLASNRLDKERQQSKANIGGNLFI